MKTKKQVFNRGDKKYRLSSEKFALMHDSLDEYLQVDSHNEETFTYPICNLYFDTDASDSISKSTAKSKDKEKLCLRSYGIPTADSKVYLEIEKKASGHGSIRRTAMYVDEAYDFIRTGRIPELKSYMNVRVLREIEHMLSQHMLKPTLYLSYERRAFSEIGNRDLRITFDTNILVRREDLSLESPIYGKELLSKGEWLMEIKTSRSFPVWLTRLLSKYEIYPEGFSKYGEEYTRMLAKGIQYAENQSERIVSPRMNWRLKFLALLLVL